MSNLAFDPHRLADLFQSLYGDHPSTSLAWQRLLEVVADRAADRPARLKRRDAARDPDWHLSSRLVGYSCYADRFAGTLTGVAARIPHLVDLGVTYLHLLPIFAAAGDQNDGGFAVASYRRVDARLGTNADLETLCAALHANDIALCLDFVANHTSSTHRWAQRALAGDETFQAYYHILRTKAEVEAAERALDEVFPQSAPGNFVYVPELSGWVWSTFQSYQWDLDYRNPLVLVEMVDNLLFLLNLGVDAVRVDSAPFLWKKIGSPSRGLPQTHAVLQIFRGVCDLVAPGTALLAEAIVEPDELVRYLGAGTPPIPECHIAYQGVVMPMLWLALVEEDARPLAAVLEDRSAAPEGTTWLQYVRSHDNIEWEVLSADLMAAASIDEARVQDAVRRLHGEAEGAFSRGQPFEGGRGSRLSTNGTTASLCGLGTGTGARHDEQAVDRMLLLYGILFALPGFPVIFSGDELGLVNDEAFAQRPSEAIDSRWLHRPSIDWTSVDARRRVPAFRRLYEGLRGLADARLRAAPAMGALAPVRRQELPASLLVLDAASAGVRLSVVANFSPSNLPMTPECARALGLSGRGTELLSKASVDGVVDRICGLGVAWYHWT